MTHYSTALPFIDRLSRQRMSDQFSRVLHSTEVDLAASEGSRLNIKAATLGDWWFSAISGSGHTVISADQRAYRFTNHALLLLSRRGQHSMQNEKSVFPNVGEIALNLWEETDATTSRGNFDYVCAYIPLPDLEKAAGTCIPFGSSIATNQGAGALLGSTLCNLVMQSMCVGNTSGLIKMLPAFSDMVVSALSADDSQQLEQPETFRVRQILNYLELNMDDSTLSAKVVAERIGLSRRQLYRHFESVGDSFSHRLRKMRIQKSKHLLLMSTECSITQIAYDCGFSSPTVFGRLFRDSEGTTPRQYRLQRMLK